MEIFPLELNPESWTPKFNSWGIFMSKNRYPLELKLEVIKYYLSNQGGQKKTAKQFGMDRITVRNWVRIYQQYGIEGLELGKIREAIYYPEKFKLNVLKHKKLHNLSNEEVAKKFNIPVAHLIDVWEEIYEAQQLEYLSSNQDNSSQNMLQTKDNLKQSHITHPELSDEIAYLRAENAYLKKLQALILEKRISVLKKKYK